MIRRRILILTQMGKERPRKMLKLKLKKMIHLIVTLIKSPRKRNQKRRKKRLGADLSVTKAKNLNQEDKRVRKPLLLLPDQNGIRARSHRQKGGQNGMTVKKARQNVALKKMNR